ncbi:hypothetical protein V3851_05765 [Paenibacillus sp. M1]|uniref:DinB family protein n=1 Tax=Paenibacillus haidiansis TaxID=1574488 RepID=A0ABU7VNJ5_9BACL
MDPKAFEKVFLKLTLHRMTDMYFAKLKACLQGLPHEALWTESYPGGNTTGGIVLHMSEHIARSRLRLSGMESELQQGFEQYFPNESLTSEQVIELFEEQLNRWSGIMARYIQGELPLEAEQVHQLYHLVEHAGYHLGQVIDRVQGATGKKAEFFNKGLNEAYLRQQIEADIR